MPVFSRCLVPSSCITQLSFTNVVVTSDQSNLVQYKRPEVQSGNWSTGKHRLNCKVNYHLLSSVHAYSGDRLRCK